MLKLVGINIKTENKQTFLNTISGLLFVILLS